MCIFIDIDDFFFFFHEPKFKQHFICLSANWLSPTMQLVVNNESLSIAIHKMLKALQSILQFQWHWLWGGGRGGKCSPPTFLTEGRISHHNSLKNVTFGLPF